MAKRTVILHVGPHVASGSLHAALLAEPALAAAGLAVPDVTAGDLRRAELEILRAHTAAGLRRKDVEGAWARVCRKAFRTKSDVVVSVPGFLAATPEQAALALDGLHGLRLHLVVTPDRQLDEDDVRALLGAWAGAVRKAHRVHVLPVAGRTPAELAREVAGLGSAALVAA